MLLSHVTDSIYSTRYAAIGISERLLAVLRKRKLQWFGHLVRKDNILARMFMEGMVEGKRKRGRPEK